MASAMVCADCLGDVVLRKWVEEEGEQTACGYCGDRRPARPMG